MTCSNTQEIDTVISICYTNTVVLHARTVRSAVQRLLCDKQEANVQMRKNETHGRKGKERYLRGPIYPIRFTSYSRKHVTN